MKKPHIKRKARWLSVLACVAVVVAVVSSPALGADGETTLQRSIAWQVALDGVGFSPGLIDGIIGPKTRLATREFQRVRGLKITGELDGVTSRTLKINPAKVLDRYVVTANDLAEIGSVPKSWKAKSRLRRLGHASLDWVLAEKFHCTRGLLRRLNPKASINSLRPGAKLVVPVLAEPADHPRAKYVEVNLAEKVVRVVDERKRLVAMFFCSIARHKSKLPRRDGRVQVIAPNPTYRFDPKMWPEVKEKVPGPLIIPPGPRNPVGRCWIGLSLPGVGMHGTPNPELIGKTGSHGCFRLSNWDAIRLSKMVDVGTPVKFVGHPDTKIASARR